MDLAKIRKEIDATDDQILSLFLKRMELCVGVAKYRRKTICRYFKESVSRKYLNV